MPTDDTPSTASTDSPVKHPLTIALVFSLGLAITYAFLTPPWDLLRNQDLNTALGTWAVAPCILAAFAILFGSILPSTARPAPRLRPELRATALVLVPLIAIAVIAAFHEPLRYPPYNWMERLLPRALTIATAFGLMPLFWQGTIQPFAVKDAPPALRTLLITALSALVFVPFIATTTSSANAPVLVGALTTLLLVPAILHELGLKLWTVALLSALTAFVAVYAHPAPLLL